jgi:hypothetical protein
MSFSALFDRIYRGKVHEIFHIRTGEKIHAKFTDGKYSVRYAERIINMFGINFKLIQKYHTFVLSKLIIYN